MKLGITISVIGLVAMVVGVFNHFITVLMLGFTGIALALSCMIAPVTQTTADQYHSR
jgi:uncharacterized membrane protein YiaA